MNLQEKLYLQVQAAERLVANWRKQANFNDNLIDPTFGDRITAVTLRQCAKELEEALTK